ncbi:MAG: hypothetical protein M3407_12285 [Acidobacteriota bacterium]|nr:hypothetical protein [Acidobacteriota bacterium]
MAKKRRSETTIELHEVLMIRRTAGLSINWCAECAAEVEMLTPEEAAATAGVGARIIYRRIEAGQLHFTETPDGRLLICFRLLVR